MAVNGFLSKRISRKVLRVWSYRLGGIGIRNAIRDWLRPVVTMDHPSQGIRLYVDTEPEYRIRRRACDEEPDTVAWIHTFVHPGDIFYDIGANVGVYSLVAACLRGAKVYAFEPCLKNLSKLMENARLNWVEDSIAPLALALGEVGWVGSLQEPDMRVGSGLQRVIGSTNGTGSRVVVCSLDTCIQMFGLPWPTHLKIDVDGDEAAILRGGRETLASDSLRSVMVEIDLDRARADESLDILSAYGFAERSRKRRRRNSWNVLMVKGKEHT